MTTYSVTCYPQGTNALVTSLTVQATDIEIHDGLVAFLDQSGTVAAAVPLALNPVIQKTA